MAAETVVTYHWEEQELFEPEDGGEPFEMTVIHYVTQNEHDYFINEDGSVNNTQKEFIVKEVTGSETETYRIENHRYGKVDNEGTQDFDAPQNDTKGYSGEGGPPSNGSPDFIRIGDVGHETLYNPQHLRAWADDLEPKLVTDPFVQSLKEIKMRSGLMAHGKTYDANVMAWVQEQVVALENIDTFCKEMLHNLRVVANKYANADALSSHRQQDFENAMNNIRPFGSE